MMDNPYMYKGFLWCKMHVVKCKGAGRPCTERIFRHLKVPVNAVLFLHLPATWLFKMAIKYIANHYKLQSSASWRRGINHKLRNTALERSAIKSISPMRRFVNYDIWSKIYVRCNISSKLSGIQGTKYYCDVSKTKNVLEKRWDCLNTIGNTSGTGSSSMRLLSTLSGT